MAVYRVAVNFADDDFLVGGRHGGIESLNHRGLNHLRMVGILEFSDWLTSVVRTRTKFDNSAILQSANDSIPDDSMIQFLRFSHFCGKNDRVSRFTVAKTITLCNSCYFTPPSMA